jgi:hypothetical protein
MIPGAAADMRPHVIRTCIHCAYFSSAPALIEAEIPGLRALGSAYASVRGDDGICAKHQRYIPATAACADFSLRDL